MEEPLVGKVGLFEGAEDREEERRTGEEGGGEDGVGGGGGGGVEACRRGSLARTKKRGDAWAYGRIEDGRSRRC